ncbi:hypothetical protein [Pelagibius litoralis]|uniref:hypothetical protein n=1 Tax=Pelagibius litoralis TaxID=374515 RepID=UPI00197D1CF4|nr:hypothetical protein [Pelagibius litoralis]
MKLRFLTDFPFYAEECLKIRTKAGEVVPLELNRVQRIVHDRLEAQKAETGRVRALILKARQPGISTYVGGRFYWRVTHSTGTRAFILTHKDAATDNLFAMAKRFHDHCPDLVKPQTKRSNAKELTFGLLDSGYQVGTAKAQGVGRSDTIQLFHGSEAAFWANAEDHAAGALQAVPKEAGTEIILESTAKGMGGLFYNMCQAAIRGDNGYILIFVPWFDHDEYETEPPKGWHPPEEFGEYAELHGLSPAQTYWAWAKNAELAAASGDDPGKITWRFHQEYPATVAEAFQAGGADSFIPSALVTKARQFTAPLQDHAAHVLGVDIARGGGDKSRAIDRKSRCAGAIVNETWDTDDTMEIAGNIARLQERHGFDMIFIDMGSFGAAVYDRLVELGYRKVLCPVNFGGKPSDPRRYANKRAEIWGETKDWLADVGGAELPADDESLHIDLTAPTFQFNSNQQILLEPKDKIKARLGISPDAGDALACTFAQPVIRDDARKHRGRGMQKAESSYNPHGW